jgi:Tol biopolymer transport system component
MKTKSLSIFIISIILCSCSSTKYLLVSTGESFDALTKITDDKKVSALPFGGDNDKGLYYCAKEDDDSYNIYFKDNVMSSAITQKTFGSNTNFSPNYCAKNNKIAYQCYVNNQWDIYYMDATKGRVQTQVTSTLENEANPCWSSDGKYIVFEKGTNPRYFVKSRNNKIVSYVKLTENQIWLKNTETGELQMIGNGSFPKFSHDDKQIAFVKYELDKGKSAELGTLWIMGPDGENQKQITGTDLGFASNPSWSPDDRYLVFQLRKKEANSYRVYANSNNNDIYTIKVDGESLAQHTSNKSNDFAPYWSKDNYIYFTSDRGGKIDDYKIYRFKIRIE